MEELPSLALCLRLCFLTMDRPNIVIVLRQKIANYRLSVDRGSLIHQRHLYISLAASVAVVVSTIVVCREREGGGERRGRGREGESDPLLPKVHEVHVRSEHYRSKVIPMMGRDKTIVTDAVVISFSRSPNSGYPSPRL